MQSITRHELEVVLGVDGAEAFLTRFGGKSFFLAKNPGRYSRELREMLGLDKLQALTAFYGGATYILPSAPRKRLKGRILEMLERGGSLSYIANELGCSQRYVSALKAMIRE